MKEEVADILRHFEIPFTYRHPCFKLKVDRLQPEVIKELMEAGIQTIEPHITLVLNGTTHKRVPRIIICFKQKNQQS